jgi:hypothetical protein
MDEFWGEKGYAQALYDEFLQPFECDHSYRRDPTTGKLIQRVATGTVPREKFDDSQAPRFPPNTCRNDDFYVDFDQLDPDAASERDVLSLLAESLPQYDYSSPGFWGKTLLHETKSDWTDADEEKLKGILPFSQLDKVSFNHSFIEAYNSEGSKGQGSGSALRQVGQEDPSGYRSQTRPASVGRILRGRSKSRQLGMRSFQEGNSGRL